MSLKSYSKIFRNNYKIIRKPGKSRNILATIIISKKYIDNWNKYFYKNWIKYAKKYDLGLIIFTDFIDNSTTKKTEQFCRCRNRP